jgi:hypothetical protein
MLKDLVRVENTVSGVYFLQNLTDARLFEKTLKFNGIPMFL